MHGKDQLKTLVFIPLFLGMSWEQALEKEKECASTEFEGFWLSHKVKNGKKTAILAIMDEQGKRGKKGKEGEKQYFVYRPNTGQQVKQEMLAELKKKYKKVPAEECEDHWNKQFDSSAKTCSHAFWKGNCRSRTLGLDCEVGLRKKAYNVLTGQRYFRNCVATPALLCH